MATSIGNFLQLFEIKVVISELNTANTLSSYSFRPFLVNLVIFIILLLSATLTQFETSVRGLNRYGRTNLEIEKICKSQLKQDRICFKEHSIKPKMSDFFQPPTLNFCNFAVFCATRIRSILFESPN